MIWRKVIANSGLAFFTSLSTTFTMSAFIDTGVPLKVFILFSCINAMIYAGISFFKTLEDDNNICVHLTKTRKGLSKFIYSGLIYE